MDDCIADGIAADDALASAVHAVIRYGSYERGDFVPGVSDIDFFVVLAEERDVVADVEALLESCTADLEVRDVDLAWEYLWNLDDPLNDGYPWKFLTVYQRDFRDNHAVVYGEDVVDRLPEYDFEELLAWRLDRVRETLAEYADDGDEKMLHVTVGELVRLRALVDGAESLRKDDVLSTLAEHDRDDAHRIYAQYVDGGDYDFDPERLASFARSTVAELREGA